MSSEPQYVLLVSCIACNRERGMAACLVCSRLEQAERRRGRHSPELREGEPDVVERAYALGKRGR